MDERIYQMVDEAINGIFCTLQDEMNIKSGDAEPWDVFVLHKKQEELAEQIKVILDYQMENCMEE